MRNHSLMLLANIAIILWAKFACGQNVSTGAGNATAEDADGISMLESTEMSTGMDGNLTMPNGTLNGNDTFWTTVPENLALDGMLLSNSTAVSDDESNSSIASHLEYHLNVKGPIGKDAAKNRLKRENADEGDGNEIMADLARQKLDEAQFMFEACNFMWEHSFKLIDDAIEYNRRSGKTNRIDENDYKQIADFYEKIGAIKAVTSEADKFYYKYVVAIEAAKRTGQLGNEIKLAATKIRKARRHINIRAKMAFDEFNMEFELLRDLFMLPRALL